MSFGILVMVSVVVCVKWLELLIMNCLNVICGLSFCCGVDVCVVVGFGLGFFGLWIFICVLGLRMCLVLVVKRWWKWFCIYVWMLFGVVMMSVVLFSECVLMCLS